MSAQRPRLGLQMITVDHHVQNIESIVVQESLVLLMLVLQFKESFGMVHAKLVQNIRGMELMVSKRIF